MGAETGELGNGGRVEGEEKKGSETEDRRECEYEIKRVK